ncbi:MAG TPA: protein kinase [bacterium]|nr:protein kinase [bacterium]HPN44960.1 protein kinase [bacterium]
MNFHLNDGRNLILGKQIGRGGEGNILTVCNMPNYVAKIYHNKLSIEHEQKLRSMISIKTIQLSNTASWPEALIYTNNSLTPQGILIPYFKGYELHEVYGPKSRKQLLPHATWEFLIYVARNLVYAFYTLHSHGIVLGDVNEKNFIVCDDARVKLIDCDSYQIPSTDNKYFICKVGVVHYTPPELQGKNLTSLIRNTNHDLFGLAVLIFQLLFMGRHPFAGFSSNNTINSLDNGELIRHYLYAFSRNAPSLGIQPPPCSIPISLIPKTLAELFEIAFSKSSSENKSRPTEQYWISELNKLLNTIVTCRNEKNHKYPNHLSACPWCTFINKFGVFFFVYKTINQFIDLSIEDAAAYKNAIDQLKQVPFIIKEDESYGIVIEIGKSIPPMMKFPRLSFLFGIVTIIFSLIIAFISQNFLFIFGGFIVGLKLFSRGKYRDEYINERDKRESRYNESKKKNKAIYSTLVELVNSYNKTYTTTKKELLYNYNRFINIESEYKKELQILENKRYDIQMVSFLETKMLSNAFIYNISRNRKATLLSYGIETAADVNQLDILQIPGFGINLCNILLIWKETCKEEFVYDPKKPIPKQYIDSLNKKMIDLKIKLKEDIRKDITLLNNLNSQASIKYKEIDIKRPFLIKELKQAEADFSMFK